MKDTLFPAKAQKFTPFLRVKALKLRAHLPSHYAEALTDGVQVFFFPSLDTECISCMRPSMRDRRKYHTQLANMCFDEIFDITAVVYQVILL